MSIRVRRSHSPNPLVVVAGLVCVAVVTEPLPVRAQTQPQTAAAQAVTVPSGPLTLEQVLAIAEARSEAVSIAQVGVARTEGDAIRARSAERPQLSAAASYDRSLANEFQGVFDNIDLGGGDSGDG